MIIYRDVGVEKNDGEEKKDTERKKKDSPTQSLISTSFSGQICLSNEEVNTTLKKSLIQQSCDALVHFTYVETLCYVLF